MGAYDDLFGTSGLPQRSPTRTSQPSSPYADLFGPTTEPDQGDEPSLFSKGLGAVTSVLGAPKAATDYLARKSGKHLFGLPEVEGSTTGAMLRAGVGLDPSETDSYAGRLAGRALEFGGDLLDPTLPLSFGAGRAGRLAAAGLTGIMGAGAVQEGARALETYEGEGFTPQAAEEALGAVLGAGGAALLGTHTARGINAARVAKANARAKAAADLAAAEAAQPKPFATTGTEFPIGAAGPSGSGLAFDPLDFPAMGTLRAMAPEAPTPDAPVPARPDLRAADAREVGLIADRIQGEDFKTLRNRLRTYEKKLYLNSADAVRQELARRNAPAPATPGPVEHPPPVAEPPPAPEPRYAFRARDVGERGISDTGHAQASMSEADVRRVAPSRTDAPQEVVRVDLNKLAPEDYEIIPRGEGESPWVRFKRPLDEGGIERVGDVTATDLAAASKTDLLPEPQAKAIHSVVDSALADDASNAALSTQVRMSPQATRKGVEDIRDDGRKEFSPEAIAIKRAILEETAGPNAPGWAAAPEPAQVGAIAKGEALTSPREVNLTPEAASPESTFNPDTTQPIPFNPDATQPIPPVTVLKGRPPEPGNVKPATIYQPETRVPEGSISTKAAERIPSQVEAIRESGVEDFPLVQEPARKLIFDGDAALSRLKARGRSKASDLGSAAAEGAGALKDVATYGASLIERGIRDFGAWSKEMLSTLGERFEGLGEHLRSIYDRAVGMAKAAGKWAEEYLGPSEGIETVGMGPIHPKIKPIPDQRKAASTPRESKGAAAPPPPPPAAPPPPKERAPKSPARNEGAIRTEALKETAEKPTLPDMLIEGWKSGLVSAPGTLAVANPISNIGEASVRAGEAGVAGLVDRLLTSIHGGPRTRFSGEALAQIKGAVSRLPQAGKALADGLKGVLDSEGAIPGKAGKVARVPFKLLEVGDAVTAQPNEGAVLAGLAHREAQRAGKTAAERARIEKQLTDNPTPEMLEASAKEVRDRQFKSNDDPNSLIKKLIKMRSEHKWLNVPFPFLETPVRLAELTIKRSPAGFWDAGKAYSAFRKAVKEGADAEVIARLKGEAVDKITRPLVGTVILGTFGLIARAGGMTGSGPTDPRQKGMLKDTGWQPYSFKIPNGKGGFTYVPFNRFEPISGVLGFAADLAESTNAKDANDLFEKALGSIAQNLTSKTYLQGLSDAAALIKDPTQFAGQYAANLAGSVVPNVVAKSAQALDPTVRDVRPEESGLAGLPERMGKAVMARVPGVSKLLPERRSGTGETIERPGNAVSRLLSPVQVTSTKAGKELEELLVKLDAVPSAPRNEVTANGRKIRLTDEEVKAIQDNDKEATEYLRGVVKLSRFKTMPEEEQRKFVEQTYSRYRSRGRKRVLSSSSFRRRAREVTA